MTIYTKNDHKNKRLALIPARGGSKRLPRKNVIKFHGKPMLAWSIEAAQQSNLFEDVFVSTEDEEIGHVAQKYGAIWTKRSDALAGDRVSVADVCLDFLKQNREKAYETLVVLYAASPLRSAEDITSVVALIEDKGADLAMTVTHLPYDPRETLVVDQNLNADIWLKDQIDIQRQDRATLMIDAGSVYAARISVFQKLKDFYGPNLKVHTIPKSRAVDIDTADDLALAEFFASTYHPVMSHAKAS